MTRQETEIARSTKTVWERGRYGAPDGNVTYTTTIHEFQADYYGTGPRTYHTLRKYCGHVLFDVQQYPGDTEYAQERVRCVAKLGDCLMIKRI